MTRYFTYLLICAFLGPVLTPAFADTNNICRGAANLDTTLRLGGSNSYAKACKDSFTNIQDISTRARTAHVDQQSVTVQGNSQAQLMQGAADTSAAGLSTHQQRLAIAQKTSGEFSAEGQNIKKTMDALDKNKKSMIAQNPARATELGSSFDAAGKDFYSLAQGAAAGKHAADAAATQSQAAIAQLGTITKQTQESADRLKGGTTTSGNASGGGISSNMALGLGGAALIAAGTVGGIAYFGNKAIKKVGVIADDTVKKADAAAGARIDQIETAATRLIDFASASANTVIANAEAAGKRILEQAKSDAAGLVSKLRDEIADELKNLSDAGIAKLRSEVDSMFQGLIDKATASGDTKLLATLTNARAAALDQIDTEILRRKTASGTATTTSTSSTTTTNTGSATGTGTTTNTTSTTTTNTGTTTSTSTSTATTTNSNDVTTTNTSTGTSTGTSIRE